MVLFGQKSSCGVCDDTLAVVFYQQKLEMIAVHCSPESNLVKWNVPEKPTTDSESPWHGDFESRVWYGVTSCATEAVIDYITMIFFI